MVDTDRRTSARVRVYRPLQLRQPGGGRPLVETLTKDIGTGGFKCLSTILIPVSTEVRVHLMLSTGDEPLEIRGKAAWLREIPESEQFDLGIAFLDLSPQTKRRLSVYLERLSYNTTSSSV